MACCSLQGQVGELDTGSIDVGRLDVAIAMTMRLGCHTLDARRCLLTALIVRRLRSALIDGDWEFLKQVVEEARAEKDSVVGIAKAEIQLAVDELEFRAVLGVLRSAVEVQDEDLLSTAVSRASRLKLGTHPNSNIRDAVEAANTTLSRIQRCRVMLEDAIASVNGTDLMDAVAMAAGLGFTSPLVENARSLLVRVQDVTRRANRSLQIVDRAGMERALGDCEELGLNLPILPEMRAILTLPQDQFLRRQLAAAVSSGEDDLVVDLTIRIKVGFGALTPLSVCHALDLHAYAHCSCDVHACLCVCAGPILCGVRRRRQHVPAGQVPELEASACVLSQVWRCGLIASGVHAAVPSGPDSHIAHCNPLQAAAPHRSEGVPAGASLHGRPRGCKAICDRTGHYAGVH